MSLDACRTCVTVVQFLQQIQFNVVHNKGIRKEVDQPDLTYLSSQPAMASLQLQTRTGPAVTAIAGQIFNCSMEVSAAALKITDHEGVKAFEKQIGQANRRSSVTA